MARKHSKTQNTGLIVWGLHRCLSEAMSSRDDARASTVLSLMKRHLADGTPLGEEYGLYRALWKARGTNERVARSVVRSVLGAAAGLDQSHLARARGGLLAEAMAQGIDPLHGCEEGWGVYRQIAAMSVMIRGASDRRVDESMDDAILEEDMVRFLCTPVSDAPFRPDRDRNGLSLQLAVEGFNRKYLEKISRRQAEVLDALVIAESGGDQTRLQRLVETARQEIGECIGGFKTDDPQLQERLRAVLEIATDRRRPIDAVEDVVEALGIVEEMKR